MKTPSNPAKPDIRYQEYLPVLLQGDPVVNQFLWAFEMVLSGGTVNEQSSFQPKIFPRTQQGSQTPPGLEEVIRHIHLYFNPDEGKTPAEFLPWLASWVALSLREDWNEATKRQFIRQVVPLYKIRGTKPGLEQMLGLYLKSLNFDPKVTVYDQFDQYPNYFQVEVTLPYPDPDQYSQQARITRAIIDQEKPAHTYYALRILTPAMRITGRMISFQFSNQKMPDVKTFEIKVTQSPEYPVKLIVGLNASSYLQLNTQPRIQEFRQEDSIQYRVEAELLPENAGWKVTLRRENQSQDQTPEVTLKLKHLEEPLYLSLNHLNRNAVSVKVNFDQKQYALDLHPSLRLYERYKTNKKPNLKSGNTIIGTKAGSVEPTSSQSGS